MRGGRLLRHRDFLLLWTGQSVSDVGTAVSTLVLPLIAVVSLHATPFQVGALAAAAWAPWLLVGLPAGVWVDRSGCRPLMIWCDVLRAACIGSVPVVAAFDALGMGQLFAVAFATGLATVVFQVAYQAYVPAIVAREELGEANAKLQGTNAAAQVAGPSVGGLLVQAVRAPYALVADAISYVLSVVALLGIRAREPVKQPSPVSLREQIAEGGRYVARDPILRVMTIAPALSNISYTGYEAIVVLFLVRSVHLAPSSVGLLIGLVSLGAVLGAVLARPVGRRFGTSRAVWAVTMLTAPFGLLIPLTHRGAGLAFFVAGNVVMTAGVLVYNVTIGGFRQAYCPPRLLGRVVASMRFVLFGTVPVGGLLAGTLAESVGIRSAVSILLAVNLVPGLILAGPLWRMRDLPDRPPTPIADQGVDAGNAGQ
jgi:MFS family permease